MSTIAIGDIHGNLKALEDLLSKVLSDIRPDDVLVFLGDYIDRGPNSRGVVERIVQLKTEAAFSVITLRGNHEDWMLRSYYDHTRHSWILGMEAFATIVSYSVKAAEILRHEMEKAGMTLFEKKILIPYQIFFDLLPSGHLAFFRCLSPYYRSTDVICVHGGVDLGGVPIEKQDPEVLIWGTDGFPDEYPGEEPVVYGHWDNAVLSESQWPLPRVLSNGTFGIDTISHGVLTAMRFPDRKVFQSDRYGTSDV